MTKLNRNQKAALLAKELGYTHISTVVKNHFATTYYNVNSVESVIESGWSGAPRSYRFNGRVGVRWSELPEKTISRTVLFTKLNEREAQNCKNAGARHSQPDTPKN